MKSLHEEFREKNAEIGHLKAVVESGGKQRVANLTRLDGQIAAFDESPLSGDASAADSERACADAGYGLGDHRTPGDRRPLRASDHGFNQDISLSDAWTATAHLPLPELSMKILTFTAGAARMYCGSCLRDNALAAELKRQGHDVILQPLYTPTRTDEANVSEARVFLNGISVYFDQEAAFFRKEHSLLDRLWEARWMLKLASRSSVHVDPHRLGAMTVSMLRGEDGFQSKEIRKLTDWLRAEPLPDVAVLPNSLLIGLARPIRDALGRPICCTLQGEELFLDQLPAQHRTQAIELIRAKASDVDGFVAVSEYSARYWIRQLRLPESKVHVVPLGINLEGFDRAAHPIEPVHGRLPGADCAGKRTRHVGRGLHPVPAKGGFGRGGAAGGRLPCTRTQAVPARRGAPFAKSRTGARVSL